MMLLLWLAIIGVCILFGWNEPVYFGAGFCVGYIVKTITEGIYIVIEDDEGDDE